MIDELCNHYGIKNYSINPDGSIDVDGSVDLRRANLSKLPLTFNIVTKHFWCEDNFLTSLEGSPKEVGGSFYCNANCLSTLKHSPQKVGRNFSCHYNQISSLDGCPAIIGNYFYCYSNNLNSLEGIGEVGGKIFCSDNRLHISELLAIDFDKFVFSSFEQTISQWLETTAIGTDEEKMLFKLRYL